MGMIGLTSRQKDSTERNLRIPHTKSLIKSYKLLLQVMRKNYTYEIVLPHNCFNSITEPLTIYNFVSKCWALNRLLY